MRDALDLQTESWDTFSDHRLRSRTHLFLGKPDTEENRAAFLSTVPVGRLCTPTDIANASTFLASDEAAFITGVDLEVS